MLFQVTYDRFVEEITQEKISPEGRNEVEKEELKDLVIYYLVPLEQRKVFVYIAKKDELTEVQKFNLDSVSKISKRLTDDSGLKDVTETLNKIEQNLRKIPEIETTSI